MVNLEAGEERRLLPGILIWDVQSVQSCNIIFFWQEFLLKFLRKRRLAGVAQLVGSHVANVLIEGLVVQIPARAVLKCSREKHWTPNCSQHLAWQQPAIGTGMCV